MKSILEEMNLEVEKENSKNDDKKIINTIENSSNPTGSSEDSI